MPEFLTTKRSAGKHNFREGVLIELSVSEAKELLESGAVEAVDDPTAEPEAKRVPKAKKTTKKDD